MLATTTDPRFITKESVYPFSTGFVGCREIYRNVIKSFVDRSNDGKSLTKKKGVRLCVEFMEWQKVRHHIPVSSIILSER